MGRSASSFGAADEWMSVSSRGTGPSRSYTPQSFHSLNVKEVYNEEWLNMAKTHIPSEKAPDQEPARRMDDCSTQGAGDAGPCEIVVIVDSCIEHQRRSPWVGWGEFPLFPVGDPPALSEISSRVCPHSPCVLSISFAVVYPHSSSCGLERCTRTSAH